MQPVQFSGLYRYVVNNRTQYPPITQQQRERIQQTLPLDDTRPIEEMIDNIRRASASDTIYNYIVTNKLSDTTFSDITVRMPDESENDVLYFATDEEANGNDLTRLLQSANQFRSEFFERNGIDASNFALITDLSAFSIDRPMINAIFENIPGRAEAFWQEYITAVNQFLVNAIQEAERSGALVEEFLAYSVTPDDSQPSAFQLVVEPPGPEESN